jgi:hypothetical protein
MEYFQKYSDEVKPLLTKVVEDVADRVTVITEGPWVYKLKFNIWRIGQADGISLAYPPGSGFEIALWNSKEDKLFSNYRFNDHDSVITEILRLCDIAATEEVICLPAVKRNGLNITFVDNRMERSPTGDQYEGQLENQFL